MENNRVKLTNLTRFIQQHTTLYILITALPILYMFRPTTINN